MRGFIRGACVVLFGGCVVLFGGGACMVFLGGMCGFFSFFGYNEIWSMSGRYASYWNAFLFNHVFRNILKENVCIIRVPHSDWKNWKTWKNGKAFSSQGKVREF